MGNQPCDCQNRQHAMLLSWIQEMIWWDIHGILWACGMREVNSPNIPHHIRPREDLDVQGLCSLSLEDIFILMSSHLGSSRLGRFLLCCCSCRCRIDDGWESIKQERRSAAGPISRGSETGKDMCSTGPWPKRSFCRTPSIALLAKESQNFKISEI